LLAALTPIVGTALAALAVSARASGSGSSSGTKSLVCSLDDRTPQWPITLRTGVRRTLVPPGAVSLTVCRYNGMNALGGTPQFGLRGIGVTSDRATIGQFTRELDALKPTHGIYNCPFDDDSEDLVSFGYDSGASVLVTVDPGGCNEITNGHVKRLGLDKPVVAQIGALAAKPVKGLTWATVVGHIRLCGGPAPSRCWTSGSMVGQVVADNSSNVWVAMSQQHKGRCRFTIATPGHYTFRAMGTGKQTNAVLAKTSATVRAGVTTNVVLTIPVP
jgi:hypothetical protein